MNYAFNDCLNLIFLDMSWNQLHSLQSAMFRSLTRLISISLDGNPLMHLDSHAFVGLKSITALDLSSLMITSLNDDTFVGLYSVNELDLSYNDIRFISAGAFNGLNDMESLDLGNNAVDFIDGDAFKNLTLLNLVTDKVRFCCMARHVTNCQPVPDEFSTCDDLMSNNFLRVSIWVQGVIAIAGNIFVLIWRSLIEKSSVMSILVFNFAVSDSLMGAYLIIIGSFDIKYRGEYIVYADKWKTSVPCMLAGSLSTVSSEMSVFLLVAITFDRVRAIVFPFSQRKLRKRGCIIMVISGWVVCVIIATCPFVFLDYFGNHFFGQNAVCLPFTLKCY